MRATILAAGVGRRLEMTDAPPKVLLQFGGESLLARHIRLLGEMGIERVDLAVGHQAEDIEREIVRIGAQDWVATNYNKDYERGAIVSLWTLRDAFTSGHDVLFMDGDVLYDRRMLERLVAGPARDCFLMDRRIEEGDDPVKLCFRQGLLVDFHKRPRVVFDWWGEWIGFARFSPVIARKIAASSAALVEAGHLDEIYEEAIREVVVSEPPCRFEVEDVTGLPWVEIDFPEDLRRAREEVFPALSDPVSNPS